MFEIGTLVLITGQYWYRGKFNPIDKGVVEIVRFYNGASFCGRVADGNTVIFHKRDIIIESMAECRSMRPGNFVSWPTECLIKDNGEVCYPSSL